MYWSAGSGQRGRRDETGWRVNPLKVWWIPVGWGTNPSP